MYILQQLYLTNSLSTACLGQVIIKIMQLKILLRVQWTRLVVRGLTMSFILFTNQGYPLQKSSLGQLHSDGGVVSVVRSSAGRLLLEYLSAHRLCSSGYYPKYQNGALWSGFWAGGTKRSHRDWDRRIGGLRNHRNAFSCQKFVDGDCCVTWGVVVVQHPSVCNACSHMPPFSWVFQGLPDHSQVIQRSDLTRDPTLSTLGCFWGWRSSSTRFFHLFSAF